MMKTEKATNYTRALVVLTTLFFMWGFITCMNDILIPFLKKVFDLGYFQAMLVQFAFFGAYFVGSVVYFIVSTTSGDPINRIGYKNGIMIGLLLSAFACLLFYPAAELRVFGLFLTALFILALGFTMLQIAANPYVAILGKPETASGRLNLSQGFNSLGTTLAPILGGYLVFHYFARLGEPLYNAAGNPVLTDSGDSLSAWGVQLPYLIFAGVFILLSVVVKIVDLPRFTSNSEIVRGAGALKHRHLVLGMVAIFTYVGAEVSIGSFIINYLGELKQMPEMVAKSYLALYWGGLMIGRFLGAISMGGKMNVYVKYLLMILVALGIFAFINSALYLEKAAEFSIQDYLPYLIIIVLNLVAFRIGNGAPARTLMVFSLCIISLLVTTLLSGGAVAMWSVIGVGVFNSIMWSNIFTLAIKDLGKYTSQGSSLLVMMILGGALIPPMQGLLADSIGSVQASFIIPAICYIYLAFYGWKGYRIRTN